MTFVVGVDGGNSKTDVALADRSGQILGRARGRGTEATSTDPHQVAAHLADLIGDARAQAGHNEPIEAAVCYLANADLPDEERAMERALSALGVARRVVVGNDTLAILRAGTDQGWGVGIVCGAGVNGIGVSPTGQIERYLAIGDISGDWGGGMGLAEAAVGAGLRQEDGRGAETALSRMLPAHFGLTNTWDLVVAIHRQQISQAQLYECVPILFDAAMAGDAVARDLVVRQGRELARMAIGLIKRLNAYDLAMPVILGGGVGQSRNPLMMSTFEADLAAGAPLATIQVLDQPPLAGAVAAGLDLIGAGRAAVHRARTHNWAGDHETKVGHPNSLTDQARSDRLD